MVQVRSQNFSFRFFLLAILSALFAFANQSAHAQTLTTLYSFKGGADGGNPYFAALILDAQGNVYGTTFSGEIGRAHV